MLSVNNQSAMDGGIGAYESFFATGFNEWSAPSTAMFFCNFHQGTISNVSESITEFSGYSNHYFTQGGIDAFLRLIPLQDRLNMLRMCISLNQLTSCSDSQDSISPLKSLRIKLKHRAGHSITAELVVMVLDYIDQGSNGQVFGIVRAVSSFDSNKRKKAPPASRVLESSINRGMVKVSKREQQVLRLIAHGYSSKMVADKLFISIHTASRHRTNLLDKFQAKNTAELVLMASRRFWL